MKINIEAERKMPPDCDWKQRTAWTVSTYVVREDGSRGTWLGSRDFETEDAITAWLKEHFPGRFQISYIWADRQYGWMVE